MSAPRCAADISFGTSPQELGERWLQHELHMDDRGRVLTADEIGPEVVVRDGLAVLAIGQALADRVTRSRWCHVRDVLRAGATLGDVAAALGLDDDEVRAGLRSWVDGQQRLNAREGRWGLTPAEADAVRALVVEVPSCST